jgi:hypothetical protein
MNADTLQALQQFAASTYVTMEQFSNTGVDCRPLLEAARILSDTLSTELANVSSPPWTPGGGKPPWAGPPTRADGVQKQNKWADE